MEADMSLIKILDDLKKDFAIDEKMMLDKEYQVAFVASQEEEIKKILWREIVDYIIASEMAKSDDDTIAMAGQTKLNEKRTNVRQFSKALKVYREFIAELEA
jgi:hypothetical protein